MEDWNDYVNVEAYKKGKPTVVWKNVTLKHPQPAESIWNKDEARMDVTAALVNCCVPKCVQKCCRACCAPVRLLCRCCRAKPKAEDKSDANDDKDEEKNTDRGPCLYDLNLEAQDGQLLCVVGKVGSGKSSLVLSILGEIDKVSGSVHLGGKVSYAAQSAAVINATVRENILYGNELDTKRYRKVIRACALQEDIRNLEAGDQTQIGEKGISLSGGQKQRIGLARAIYAEADVYLLDDPLSAVSLARQEKNLSACFVAALIRAIACRWMRTRRGTSLTLASAAC